MFASFLCSISRFPKQKAINGYLMDLELFRYLIGTHFRGEGHQHDQFIFKKERRWKIIDVEAGQVRVVLVFKESTSRTASLLHNYELNCIDMDPNSLLVPQYITANMYMYAYKGLLIFF